MKKLQCEVCGSTEIRKLDDDLFECQSCGIQYSKSEVQKLLVELTGEVKIDRSEEVENLLVRAAEFQDSGDTKRAQEYYNRVLDLQPDNEEAREGLASLDDENEDLPRNTTLVKVLPHTMQPDEGLDCLLKSLQKAPDVTPDVFRDIEVMSVTSGYYPFAAVTRQATLTYDAIACYRKQVPYTDYVTKTDYHNKNQDGSYRKYQEAVTKYREEIERKKVDGSLVVQHKGTYTACGRLNRLFTSLAPLQYNDALDNDRYDDAALGTTLQRNYAGDSLLQHLEQQVSENYEHYANALTETALAEDGQLDGLEVVTEVLDDAWEKRFSEKFNRILQKKGADRVKNALPGDFTENVHCYSKTTYNHTEEFYLPIQVIEYAYRGKFYLAAMVLTRETEVLFSYPCTTEIKRAESEANQAVAEVKNTPFPNWLIIAFVFAASFMGCGIFLAFPAFLGIGAVPGAIAAFFTVRWKRKKDAAMKETVDAHSDTLDAAKKEYDLVLSRSAQAFFTAFSGLSSMKAATAAASEATSFRTELSFIKARVAKNSVTAKGGSSRPAAPAAEAPVTKPSVPTSTTAAPVTDTAEVTDIDGMPLTAGCFYTARLMPSAADTAAVAKVLRDARGIGMLTAKEMAATPPAIIAKGISAEAATSLAKKLWTVGAVVEIEKEA